MGTQGLSSRVERLLARRKLAVSSKGDPRDAVHVVVACTVAQVAHTRHTRRHRCRRHIEHDDRVGGAVRQPQLGRSGRTPCQRASAAESAVGNVRRQVGEGPSHALAPERARAAAGQRADGSGWRRRGRCARRQAGATGGRGRSRKGGRSYVRGEDDGESVRRRREWRQMWSGPRG